MEGGYKVASFKVMNQCFVKLDRFNGTNLTLWRDRMKFLLTALNILFILCGKKIIGITCDTWPRRIII